jgi:hypothetical protein
MPTHKPHFVPRDLQFLASTTYRHAKLLESDRLLAAELRSAPAAGCLVADIKTNVGATRDPTQPWVVS